MRKHIIRIAFIGLGTLLLMGGTRILSLENSQNYVVQSEYSWADSVLQTLTLEEKIAQLISIRAHSDKDASYNDKLIQQVEKYQVGGACFFQGGLGRQAIMTNRMQKASKIPMMISIDRKSTRLNSSH